MRRNHSMKQALGGRFGYLLVALLALMLTAPLITRGWAWGFLLGALSSAVLVAGLAAARPERRSLAVGLLLAVVDLALGRLVYLDGGRWLVLVQAALWLLTLGYVGLAILDRIFENQLVKLETIQASLCVYLLMGLMWVYLYGAIEVVAPGSFHRDGAPMVRWTDDASRRREILDLFVFSYSTLAMTGFGGLEPSGGFPRICICLEALLAQIYLAVVIARLVGSYVVEEEEESREGGVPRPD